MKTGTVIDLFGGVRGTLFAALALLWFAIAAVLYFVAEHRAGRITALEAAGHNWANAQDANLAVIADLKTRIDNMVRAWSADQAAAREAAQAAAAEATRINAQLAATQHELGEVYARVPSARAWAATAVDPAVAARLPGGSGEDAHRRGQGAGAGAARP